MCRCKNAVTNAVKQKVSLFCHVPPEQVRNVGVGVNNICDKVQIP